MKNKRRLFSVIISLIMAASLSLSAFASSLEARSPERSIYSSYLNHTFKASSTVLVYPDDAGGADVGAITFIYSPDYPYGSNIPIGHMGVQPRLFLNDSLLFATNWSYNTGTGNALSDSHSTYFVSRSGNVYAKGAIGLYNGDGYDIYYTYSTPSVSVASATPSAIRGAPQYGVNNKGQTYGPGCYDTIPDLIKAIGIDETNGYVLNSDLLNAGKKSSPESSVSNITTIPLYAKDGTTVIGQFAIKSPGSNTQNFYQDPTSAQ